MATSNLPKENSPNDGELPHQKYGKTYEKFDQIVATLPKGKGLSTEKIVQYQGFWMNLELSLIGLLLIEDHFRPQPTDVYLASSPKTGTTWLKSLIFATVNRARYDFSSHPLLKTHPHDHVPFLERHIQKKEWATILENLPSPRLISTHLPYSLLPESFLACKFVYVCRDPKDVVISMRVFINSLRQRKGLPPFTLEEAFDLFCKGHSPYGPYWDHVLEYWKASLENPDKILFLKYEEMKKNPLIIVMKLAEFLGQPFSEDEEKEGVVEEIIKLCSFKNLSNLDVNKASGTPTIRIGRNKDFFRKGEVGDWMNHLTPEMAAYIDSITEEKLQGFSFSFGSPN